jgi:hypothetical protein
MSKVFGLESLKLTETALLLYPTISHHHDLLTAHDGLDSVSNRYAFLLLTNFL